MIVVDTTVVFALLDRRDRGHERARAWYEATADRLATTPLVLAEVDYFASRAGRAALSAFRRDVARGSYLVEWWPSAPQEIVEVAERYTDFGVSMTDASLVALAARIDSTVVATFDERHFRAIRPLSGENAFTLLPADWTPA